MIQSLEQPFTLDLSHQLHHQYFDHHQDFQQHFRFKLEYLQEAFPHFQKSANVKGLMVVAHDLEYQDHWSLNSVLVVNLLLQCDCPVLSVQAKC